MKRKTRELSGAALDWAVAKAEGRNEPELVQNFAVAWYTWGNVHYSTDWSLGGPIIERERIRIDCPWSDGPFEASCKIDGHTGWMVGTTVLIAAMRCYVSAKLGDEIEIPEELK